jgi:tetratricopeptide (TPR) repeat protein
MNRQQIILIASAVALFFILYFGCDVQSKEQKTLETARVLTGATMDMAAVIKDATKTLTPAQFTEIQSLTQKAEANKDPSVASVSAMTLKQLSAAWHNAGHDEVAAHYAEQVAELDKTDEAWSIAGANYYLALQKSEDKSVREFCANQAAKAFQNAASLNPTKLEYRINLALCFTENPPQDNPMKGILLLRELDAQNPENVAVNTQLARLAIKTGQFEKAIARLEKVSAKEPNNGKLACMLAEAYSGANSPKAAEANQKCQSLSK